MTIPASEPLPDPAAPDGLLVVHGEILSSEAWETVFGSAVLGALGAGFDPGIEYEWEAGMDVIADIPAPARALGRFRPRGFSER